jgi:hypothetical protein
MSQAVIVLAIIVSGKDASGPATDAMRAAAGVALGSRRVVAVREEEVLSDDVALDIEDSLGARAVVQVAWVGDDRTQAHVRLHIAQNDRWIDRTISFAAADTMQERGRAVGFAITSMIPEEELAAARAPPPTPTPPAAPAAPPAGPPRLALHLTGIGSTGIGGSAGGVGAALAGELFVVTGLSVRVGAGARDGEVPGLRGTDLAVMVSGGIGLWPLPPAPNRLVAVALRIDGLALHHDLSHEVEAGGATSRQGRWLPGLDVIAELSWSFSRTVAAVTGAGVEVAFGNTDVVVDDAQVATLPPLRGVAEVGLRVSF